jgi:hypothetical protein
MMVDVRRNTSIATADDPFREWGGYRPQLLTRLGVVRSIVLHLIVVSRLNIVDNMAARNVHCVG